MSMLKILHRSLTEGRTLYAPNTKTSDFKRWTIIFVHKFVSSNDESISPSYFFTLGKMGKPYQTPWVMPFHVIENVFEDTIPANLRVLILQRNSLLTRLYWLTICSFATSTTGVTIKLAALHPTTNWLLLTDLTCVNIHEMLCAKILEGGGN